MENSNPPVGQAAQEPVLAQFFPEAGNHKHELLLSSKLLLVKRNHVITRYPVAALVKVEARHIRVMLQYLAGGLICCLSLIGIQHNLIHPLPGLLLAMAGAVTFYLGWRGRVRFTVHLHDDTGVYWFPGSFSGFSHFCNTVNKALPFLQQVQLETQQPEQQTGTDF